MTCHHHTMPFGATLLPEGGVRFRLWAPADVSLVLDVDGTRHAVDSGDDDWVEVTVADARAGSRYQWILQREGEDDLVMPDPASRSNPDGVHAPSVVVDPAAFDWQQDDWRAGPWQHAVVYEMHIGAFTPEGTFTAAIAKLPALAEAGINTLQVMPLSSFAGRFGWGYDGVLHFAPHAPYGSPDDLKRFVEAAHGLGLAVMLDVVYNHFGPDGNYLSLFAPDFFNPAHSTAWGAAINFDAARSSTVRDFFIHNALYWLDEYRFDGLRFDAVHAIRDDSTPHVLNELAARVHERCGDRRVYLVLENDNNDAGALRGNGGAFDGQWNDDHHHVMHVLLTGEHHGYYGHYAVETLAQLARVLTRGFTREGASHLASAEERIKNPRHSADSTVPLTSLLDFLHNHDQVGNRAFGERLTVLVPPERLRLATAMLLLAPAPVMLFMGEEHGATTPFYFFADWSGELGDAVREGRRREFAQFPEFADPEKRELIPDPCAAATFEASKLDWAAFDEAPSREWHAFMRELLAMRRRELWPALDSLATGEHAAELHGDRGLCVRWRFGARVLQMTVNLSDEPMVWPGEASTEAQVVMRIGEVSGHRFGPWSGLWRWTA